MSWTTWTACSTSTRWTGSVTPEEIEGAHARRMTTDAHRLHGHTGFRRALPGGAGRPRGITVAGVFTQPDKPKGRGKKMAPPPVKVAAQAHGIPVYQPRRIRKDGVEDLRVLAPDLCITAAFGQILSQEILDIPRLGTINVHASLLPRHRGSAPIAWGILQGDQAGGHYHHVHRQGH